MVRIRYRIIGAVGREELQRQVGFLSQWAVHRLPQQFHNRESKARARLLRSIAAPLEALEHPFLIGLRNTDPLVDDLDRGVLCVHLQHQTNRLLVRGILIGIFNQIQQHLPQAVAIGVDHNLTLLSILWQLQLDRALQRVLRHLHRLLELIGKGNRFADNCETAESLRQVEQIIEQARIRTLSSAAVVSPAICFHRLSPRRMVRWR